VAEVLPLLYRHGGFSSDFGPALTQFLGTSHGLSAATITRLTKDWQDEATTFNERSLAGTGYVYCWVEGIYLKVRLEQDKVCLLVMIGVRADGTMELIALDDGHRESIESSLDLLRGCKRSGMAAPVLAVGDGALGFWSGVREVFPETREQRCWWHQIGDVLDALPKSARPGAKEALAEIWNAEDKDHAQAAANVFAVDYGTKWRKAAAEITDDLDVLLAFYDDLDVLLAFYDYPAEHWIHVRTTNPIESTFATVRLRQRVTNGPGSRAAGVAMAFKLIESAQTRWRAVNAPHLVPLVRAGAVFKNGKLIERPDESEGGDQQVA
jgi:putative transposase